MNPDFITPPHLIYEKEDQLYDWVTTTGKGVMGFNFGDVPDDCFTFCMEQYQRFKVPCPDEITEVVIAGASAALYYLDVIDPYCLFSGVSDVDITDEWAEAAYEIVDPRQPLKAREAQPEWLETYRANLQQGDQAFNHMLANPGLEAIPHGFGHNVRDVLRGEFNGEEMWDSITRETEVELRKLCLEDGEISKRKLEAYFELAGWAAFVWIAGPLGRRTRMERHDVFKVALSYGAAILYEGAVIHPSCYRRLERPPQSCHRCGLAAYCVELTQVDGYTRYICEHCSSIGMPLYGGATCGSKHCLLTQCPHHPHPMKDPAPAGIASFAKKSGQLISAAHGLSATRVVGGVQGLP